MNDILTKKIALDDLTVLQNHTIKVHEKLEHLETI